MERNRVLWVIFSVSLFLVVVLAAGLYFLRPRSPEGPEAAVREAPAVESFDPFEYVRGRSGLPGLRERPAQGEEAEEMVIIVGEPEGPAGAEPLEDGEVPVARELVPGPGPGPGFAPGPAPAPAGAVSGTAAPARPVAAPPERPERASSPAARPAPLPAPKPAPKPAPQPVRVAEYWIQVGSFSSRSRADELRDSLVQRGLAPKVTTRVVAGATRFRVRLGPYANKPEAEKFLQWVKALEGMEGSYISMVTVQRPQR